MTKRWIGCPTEADYFGDDRKLGRQDRKRASAKDRSKYKKTDQRKQEKQIKEIPQESESLKRGRVLSIASQGVIVDYENSLYTCTLRGALKKEKTQSKNLVAVGDFVLFEITSPAEGSIVYVEPRRSVLSRSENLSRRKEQVIAANIDQVLITASVMLPPLKPPLIDRYIIAAQKGGMEPIVVVNKIDLLKASDQDPTLLENELALFEEMKSAYAAAGIRMVAVSSNTGEGLDLLKELMRDKASVFSGQSGVGKSSLIMAMTGLDIRVGGIVDKTKKGMHTTTSAQLIPLEKGGWCIDTPGIKSFGVWDLDKEEIEHYFPEIFECGHQCKFPDCSHIHEEGCAVVAAVESGEISPLRYDSYASLIQSIQEIHRRR